MLDRLLTTRNITCLRIVAEALEGNIGCGDRPLFVLATVQDIPGSLEERLQHFHL